MVELFPAKCDEILHCSSSLWAGVVMNHYNTLAKHATLLILDRAMQFFKCVAIDTCVDCGALRQDVHKQKAFSIPKHCTFFRVEMVCLNFVFVGDEVCLHSMDCCFSSGVVCDTHVSSPVTKRLKKLSPSSLHRVRRSNTLACHFNLCFSVSIFGTQRAHNFRNPSSSDTIS